MAKLVVSKEETGFVNRDPTTYFIIQQVLGLLAVLVVGFASAFPMEDGKDTNEIQYIIQFTVIFYCQSHVQEN